MMGMSKSQLDSMATTSQAHYQTNSAEMVRKI